MTEYNDTTNVPATDVGAATLALARKAGWTIDRSVTFALPPSTGLSITFRRAGGVWLLCSMTFLPPMN